MSEEFEAKVKFWKNIIENQKSEQYISQKKNNFKSNPKQKFKNIQFSNIKTAYDHNRVLTRSKIDTLDISLKTDDLRSYNYVVIEKFSKYVSIFIVEKWLD